MEFSFFCVLCASLVYHCCLLSLTSFMGGMTSSKNLQLGFCPDRHYHYAITYFSCPASRRHRVLENIKTSIP